jgi:hypothetical protein
MYRHPLFWFVILLSISFTSMFPEMDDWWYDRKPFSRKVQTAREEFLNGIVLPFFALENDYPYKQTLDEIDELGARSVSLFITNYQEDIRTNYIYINQRAAEVTQLTEIVAYAHRRGLSVFLFPTLHIQHLGYKEWRGVLEPKDPEIWWQNYFRLVQFYIHFAQQNKVEMLSIGSELCSLESDARHWGQIVSYARSHYDGLLTYSANWDHYHDIVFMKDLDFMGINAYFRLTEKMDPSVNEIVAAWKPARERIEDAYKEYGKPLIFTEIGYLSLNGTNHDPWNYFSTEKIDLQEQADCYQAFVRVWNPPPRFLHGVYFYNWWGQGGPNDRDYTPRGKPAELILRRWYQSF